jgi:hypothetical protein
MGGIKCQLKSGNRFLTEKEFIQTFLLVFYMQLLSKVEHAKIMSYVLVLHAQDVLTWVKRIGH